MAYIVSILDPEMNVPLVTRVMQSRSIPRAAAAKIGVPDINIRGTWACKCPLQETLAACSVAEGELKDITSPLRSLERITSRPNVCLKNSLSLRPQS